LRAVHNARLKEPDLSAFARIPVNRLDLLAKTGLMRDFTHVVLAAEGVENLPVNARRVWVAISELNDSY